MITTTDVVHLSSTALIRSGSSTKAFIFFISFLNSQSHHIPLMPVSRFGWNSKLDDEEVEGKMMRSIVLTRITAFPKTRGEDTSLEVP
ncbi:hypothetical protein Tco_0438698 [Tanacetum coccineum]